MLVVFWQGKLKILILVVISMMLLAAGLTAQTSSSTPGAASPFSVFGGGVQTPLRFAGESS